MHTKELSLDEIQKIEFDLLVLLRDYCQKHGLTYCLCGGTLLGAVRHKGFIPWDDDIDLFMPRKDYDRFIALARQSPVGEFVEVLKAGDENYPYPLIKVVNTQTVAYERNLTDPKQAHGVGIDIFPLDKMYPARRRNFPLLARIKFLIQLSKTNAKMVRAERDSVKKKLRTLVMALLRPVARFTPYCKINRKIDRIAKSKHRLKRYMLGNLAWPNRWKDMFDASVFEKYVELPFCGEMFPAPHKYHEYLTTLYGDYMVVPKPGDRVAHSFRAYWKEDISGEVKP